MRRGAGPDQLPDPGPGLANPVPERGGAVVRLVRRARTRSGSSAGPRSRPPAPRSPANHHGSPLPCARRAGPAAGSGRTTPPPPRRPRARPASAVRRRRRSSRGTAAAPATSRAASSHHAQLGTPPESSLVPAAGAGVSLGVSHSGVGLAVTVAVRVASGWRPGGVSWRCASAAARHFRDGGRGGRPFGRGRRASWSGSGAVRVGLGTDAVTDPSGVRVGLAVGAGEPSPPPPPQA